MHGFLISLRSIRNDNLLVGLGKEGGFAAFLPLFPFVALVIPNAVRDLSHFSPTVIPNAVRDLSHFSPTVIPNEVRDLLLLLPFVIPNEVRDLFVFARVCGLV
jgi:hypothetical protein